MLRDRSQSPGGPPCQHTGLPMTTSHMNHPSLNSPFHSTPLITPISPTPLPCPPLSVYNLYQFLIAQYGNHDMFISHSPTPVPCHSVWAARCPWLRLPPDALRGPCTALARWVVASTDATRMAVPATRKRTA